MKNREWSFDRAVKQAVKALRGNRSLERERQFFEQRMSDPSITLQELAPNFQLSLGVTYWCQALVAAEDEPEVAWEKVHAVWRSYALSWQVHLERLDQLAREFPEKLRRGRLGISLIDYNAVGQILMTVAFSASLGEDEAARWLGDRCVRMVVNREPITKPNMLSTGSTEPFLFRLYCLWRGVDVDYAGLGVKSYGPFTPLFEHWLNPAGLEPATLQLCRLHAFKAANVDLPDDDFVFGLQEGPFREFPAEILFFQRVRRDLGLPISNPEHALLRSPLMRIPFPCPRSGYDPYLDWIYRKCKQSMPQLDIPSEENIGKERGLE